MQIQLDYYRVLGLTPQAQIGQIKQAHGDRVRSLPRREYSEKAILARQKLLDVAYTVLADRARREVYDAQIMPELIKSQDVQAFFIEIDELDLSGALLILSELGEYDQIISLSKAISLPNLDSDSMLSIVLAYLEIGRELWSQGKYEAASQKLDSGMEITDKSHAKLLQFPEIRQELQANGWQLQPYRVLELMSSGMTTEGTTLLKQLLDLRQGIDGKGEDHSGLDIDKFLQFILELRVYMTSSEQIEFFSKEATRPSLVASYLSFSALIAKGIFYCEPDLIFQARTLLVKIGAAQNVCLDEAICTLLLGQLTEAVEILNRSNETDKIAAIYQMSEPEDDLAKGLYCYTQTWLNTEICPNFKDLIGQTLNLETYFGDQNVQAYIDKKSSSAFKTPIKIPPTDSDFASNFDSDFVPDFVSDFDSDFSSDFSPGSFDEVEVPSQNLTARQLARRRTKYKFHPLRFLIFLFGVVGGSAVLGYVGWNYLNSAKAPIVKPIPAPVVTPPQVIIPKPPEVIIPKTEFNQKMAEELVTTWQTIKAEALGKKFEVEKLEKILTEPLLSEWKSRAQNLKTTNSYLEYTLKSIAIREFKLEDESHAKALTDISETRNYFTGNKLDQRDSKSDSYQVEYVLTKIDGRWMISGMNLKP